jgi:alkanesulfonate monooxygenase SsuD/methylene tetrahydromethanopterin reductase-like flavin-dependent oxidoreductase (luciferase family)
MKFSLMYEAQLVDPTPANEHKILHDIVEQCILAEQVGFDGVWSVEHHGLTRYSHMSAPETLLAFVAGKTKTLEVGHGVVCLPPAMNHPIKVAARIATLDVLSNGRVNFGMGKGSTQQEAGAFGYDLADLPPQIEEMMYLIPKILAEGKVDHDGKYVKIPARPVHPRPVQQPHPKLYMACTRMESVREAATRGIGALVMGFGGPDEVAEKVQVYREAFANRPPEKQVGFAPNNHVSCMCATVVLGDRERARRIGLRGQRYFVECIKYWYNNGPIPTVFDEDSEESAAAIHRDMEEFVAYLGEQKIEVTQTVLDPFKVADDAYGDVEDCLRHVRRLAEAGADEIMFMVQMGGVSQEVMLETIRNIGAHVIPHFREPRKLSAAE